ncbi:MAG: GNAT family N-acetyltransferase [Acidimicrobiia bacterium]|nr:GNAT family N-acetyltransferase [Acidimicrobiia bacterium]
MTALPEPIENVTFRHFGGDEDFVGMVAMLKAQARHDGVDRHDSVEEMTNYYHHLTNCDLETDLAIAERSGEIVAYCRATWWVEESTADRVLAFIEWTHPEVRSLGVEGALVGWGESRSRDIAVEQAYEGHQVLQTWADEPEQDKIKLIEATGFAVTQTDVMMTRSLDVPIPELHLPEGLEIRPVTEADRRKVWEADLEAFRDHVGFSLPTEEDFEQFANQPHFDPALWKVAFDGDEIASQVLNYVAEDDEPGRKRGWTEWISTQRAWRGKGAAKAVIAESMRMFKDMGMTEVALAVHTTNPTGALGLYQGLGYQEVQRSFEFRKPF